MNLLLLLPRAAILAIAWAVSALAVAQQPLVIKPPRARQGQRTAIR
jgi:hypothetical protein